MLLLWSNFVFTFLGINQEHHRAYFLQKIDALRIEHGLFTEITFPAFDDEDVKFEFTIGLISPHDELIENHIKLWMTELKCVEQKHVNWYM